MIAKVLWQAWLNWWFTKFIYTAPVEQHLWCVLWKLKRSLLESQPRKCCSPMLDTTPKPLDSLAWASPASHPTYLTKPLCFWDLFMTAVFIYDSGRPGWKALRCSSDCPLSSLRRLCHWGGSHWSQGSGNSLWNWCLMHFRAALSPGCLGVQKDKHCFISSVFTNIKHSPQKFKCHF